MKGRGLRPPLKYMNVDQAKLINIVLDKNTKKISELQSQIFILEAQLQLVTELNSQLQESAEKVKKKESKSDFQN